MNKQQFIEKCRKELDSFYNPDGFSTDSEDLKDFLQSKLSKCWDMAQTQKIELKHGTKKYYRGWSKLGKIMDSLASK